MTSRQPEKEGQEHAGKIYLYEDAIVVPESTLAMLDFPYTVLNRQKAYEDIESLGARATTVINKKVNVSVPGFGLLCMNQVKVECDLCTEILQGELDAGWRILAICPQPDQRRPDYVLGRVKENTQQDDS
jgi:hypothetical protein